MPKKKLTAKTANKHFLYEESVQDPESDVHFMVRIYRKERDRDPKTLREDFCGTAAVCAEWVKRKPERRSVGLDLHQPTMDYGMRRHIEPLGDAAKRVKLLNRNVLDGTKQKFDVIAAFNFSYSVFKERKELLKYFRVARRDVKADGVFFVDLYSGPDAQVETYEKTRCSGFTYIWEQKPIDAVSNWGMRYIHYDFPDGTKMKRAFSYDWRLWGLPELRDILFDAGFSRVDTYWEDSDEDGEGTGVFRKVRRVENEDAYVAYLAAWP